MSRSSHRGGAACAAALLLPAAVAFGSARCGGRPTELIVVVGTDLAPGTEVDTIEIQTDDGDGHVQERPAAIASAKDLPVTLGVNAGPETVEAGRPLTFRAQAYRGGVVVASAVVRAAVVRDESRVVKVDLCRSCAGACPDRTYSAEALPAWSGVPPVTSCGAPTTGPDGGSARLDAAADVAIDAPVVIEEPDAAVPPVVLAHWDFEEADGTVVIDRSGKGADGTLRGNAALLRGPGKTGKGVVFDARPDESFTCPLFGAGLPARGALSFWLRDDDTEPAELPASPGYFSNQNRTADHFFIWREKVDAPQALKLAFQRGLGTEELPTYAAVQPFLARRGEWIQVVVSWTQDAARLRAGNASFVIPFDAPWSGTRQGCDFGRGARAAFDEIRFWDRDLTEQEMTTRP